MSDLRKEVDANDLMTICGTCQQFYDIEETECPWCRWAREKRIAKMLQLDDLRAIES